MPLVTTSQEKFFCMKIARKRGKL